MCVWGTTTNKHGNYVPSWFNSVIIATLLFLCFHCILPVAFPGDIAKPVWILHSVRSVSQMAGHSQRSGRDGFFPWFFFFGNYCIFFSFEFTSWHKVEKNVWSVCCPVQKGNYREHSSSALCSRHLRLLGCAGTWKGQGLGVTLAFLITVG